MNMTRKNIARKKLPGKNLARNLVRLLPAVAVVAMLTGTAYAQIMPKFNLSGDDKRKLTPEEQEKKKQLDDAYKQATSKIPDQKADDPWANVRPAPATPAPAPKKKQP
jgi:hypothetical protein